MSFSSTSFPPETAFHAMSEQNSPQSSAYTPQNPAPGQNQTVIRFDQLAQGANEVLVEHEGQIYRLRLTRNGKLILNK